MLPHSIRIAGKTSNNFPKPKLVPSNNIHPASHLWTQSCPFTLDTLPFTMAPFVSAPTISAVTEGDFRTATLLKTTRKVSFSSIAMGHLHSTAFWSNWFLKKNWEKKNFSVEMSTWPKGGFRVFIELLKSRTRNSCWKFDQNNWENQKLYKLVWAKVFTPACKLKHQHPRPTLRKAYFLHCHMRISQVEYLRPPIKSEIILQIS